MVFQMNNHVFFSRKLHEKVVISRAERNEIKNSISSLLLSRIMTEKYLDWTR